MGNKENIKYIKMPKEFESRGGVRGGFGRGPPPSSGNLMKIGEFMHECEKGVMLFKATAKNVPKFNREVFNGKGQDKQKLGTIEEIMGPFNAYLFSVIPAEGVSAKK